MQEFLSETLEKLDTLTTSMDIGGSTVKGTPNGTTNGHRNEAGETPKTGSTGVPTIEAIRDLIAYSRELVVSVLQFKDFDRELTACIV
jgi:hypothetical protein